MAFDDMTTEELQAEYDRLHAEATETWTGVKDWPDHDQDAFINFYAPLLAEMDDEIRRRKSPQEGESR